MARFLRDTDYAAAIRQEIKNNLDDDDQSLLFQAEQRAQGQIANHLAARYDIEAIFRAATDGEPDTRDPYVVMLMIDLALYHLWSRERGKIPEVRAERYQDALNWLRDVGAGRMVSALPSLPDEQMLAGTHVWSLHRPNNNKY